MSRLEGSALDCLFLLLTGAQLLEVSEEPRLYLFYSDAVFTHLPEHLHIFELFRDLLKRLCFSFLTPLLHKTMSFLVINNKKKN